MSSLSLTVITIVGFWINYSLNFVSVFIPRQVLRRILRPFERKGFSSGTAKSWTKSSHHKCRGLFKNFMDRMR
jgi:hypothetical protein